MNLAFRFRHPEDVLGGQEPEGHAGPPWSPKVAICVLGGAAALLAVLSEQLVGAIDPFIEQFDLTPFFVGVILIPTIGNLSEHLVAVQLAVKDRVDFTMAVSMGSSLQVALFVAPVLVLIGLVVNQPMDLVFAPLEVAAVAVAAGIAALVSLDGESNWLEGALLLGVYAILGVSFFYLGIGPSGLAGRRQRGRRARVGATPVSTPSERAGRFLTVNGPSGGCWAGPCGVGRCGGNGRQPARIGPRSACGPDGRPGTGCGGSFAERATVVDTSGRPPVGSVDARSSTDSHSDQ